MCEPSGTWENENSRRVRLSPVVPRDSTLETYEIVSRNTNRKVFNLLGSFVREPFCHGERDTFTHPLLSVEVLLNIAYDGSVIKARL